MVRLPDGYRGLMEKRVAMVSDFAFREKYGFEDLVGIMALLRGENGCPWDREQTHRSVRSNFIEETYEAVEAIDTDDPVLLCEELGDVLLQVVFHAQMEREKGRFDIRDVVDGICKKLIVRHPHVFGDVRAASSDEVLRNWDEIKKHTKGQSSETQGMESVSRALPALMRSRKVQQKAAKSGMDFPDAADAAVRAGEELGELREALRQGDAAGCRQEVGDLLFSAVNVARLLHIDPEEALTESCDKFIRRFSQVERMAADSGRPMAEMSPGQLGELWEKAKRAL